MDSNGEICRNKRELGDVDFSESETGSFHEEEVTGRPVAFETAKGQPYASSKSDHPGSPQSERIEGSHNLFMSPATVHHLDSVFSIVRKIYGRERDDLTDDLDVSVLFGSYF